jgi:integrase
MSKHLTIAVRNYAALEHQVRLYQADDLSPLTRRLYDDIWQAFTNFLAPKDAWRAEPMDVARYVTSRALRGITPGTLKRDLGGINYYFERLGKGAGHRRPGVGTRSSPARDALVVQTMRGIWRKHGRPYSRKRGLLLDSLEKMIDHQPDTLVGIRNRAMFVIGWGAALRIIELQALDAKEGGVVNGWVEISDDGVVVHLRQSKANQFRRRAETYGIPARPSAPRYCPVKLMRQWLSASSIESGPLFPALRGGCYAESTRINRNSLRAVIKRGAGRIGIDPADIGGQSLRRGCLTWLSLEGVNPFRIQDHSGHSDIRQLFRYIERPFSIQDSPLAETRWAR